MLENFTNEQLQILKNYLEDSNYYSTLEEFKRTFENCSEKTEQIGKLTKKSYYKEITEEYTNVFISVIYYNDKVILFTTGCDNYDNYDYIETGYLLENDNMIIYTFNKIYSIPTFIKININTGKVKPVYLRNM